MFRQLMTSVPSLIRPVRGDTLLSFSGTCICRAGPRLSEELLAAMQLCEDNFPFGFKGMAHLGKDRSDLDVGLEPLDSFVGASLFYGG